MKNGQNNEDYPKNFNEDPKIFYSLFMVKRYTVNINKTLEQK